MSGITISTELGGALMTLLRLGTFPIQYAQIKDVEAALLAEIEAAGVNIEEVPAEDAVIDNGFTAVGGTD